MATVYGIPTSDFAGPTPPSDTWTPSTGVNCFACVDEFPFSDTDFISRTNDGSSEHYSETMNLTKDAGTWVTAFITIRAKATSADTMTVTLYNGSTIIESYTTVALTTSYATQSLANLSAGDLTAWNAAGTPRITVSAQENIPGNTVSVSGIRVEGTTASASVSQFMQTGIGCLAASAAIFGPWFQSKSNQLRAYPGCAL